MAGVFPVNAIGRHRGLAVLWNEECKVDIQSYFLNHVDTLVEMEEVGRFNLLDSMASQNLTLELSLGTYLETLATWLTKTGSWGDFNEVLDAFEKSEGRQKSKATMEDFRRVTSDLALVDIKPDRG